LTSQRIFIRRGWAAALALVALLCLAAFAPAAAMAGSISGTVTEAATDEPLEGVEVCAYALGFEDWACGETVADGTYTLTGLFSGEYEVEFWSGGRYLTQFYDGKAHWWEADPVSVDTSTTTTGIDAALLDAATIEGTVTAGGTPVAEVSVCLWDGTVNEYLTCEETGFDGTYEISGLEAGEYRVEFWPGWTGLDLAAQYFDHKFQLGEADPIAVEAGETATEVDGELEAGAEISGTVTSLATGVPLKWIYVCAIEALTDELWLCTETNSAGGYSLAHLSQGQYKVVFSIDFEEWFGEEEGFEEDDGYPTQFWNNQTMLAAASAIPIATGAAVSGIDARLGPPAPPVPPPPTVTPPTVNPPAAHKPRKRKCRRGFKRKKVKGRVRCVKVRKHRRHRPQASLQARAPFQGAGPELRHLFR
jgi:Carboxypeptidase regulatory-like domain